MTRVEEGDFSVGMTVNKIILIERVEDIESPTLAEFSDQEHACFVMGHERKPKVFTRICVDGVRANSTAS